MIKFDQISTHVRLTLSETSDQLPNLTKEDLDENISSLLECIGSFELKDRLQIRRQCWELFPDSSMRQIIDLCFPAQLGIKF